MFELGAEVSIKCLFNLSLLAPAHTLGVLYLNYFSFWQPSNSRNCSNVLTHDQDTVQKERLLDMRPHLYLHPFMAFLVSSEGGNQSGATRAWRESGRAPYHISKANAWSCRRWTKTWLGPLCRIVAFGVWGDACVGGCSDIWRACSRLLVQIAHSDDGTVSTSEHGLTVCWRRTTKRSAATTHQEPPVSTDPPSFIWEFFIRRASCACLNFFFAPSAPKVWSM